MQDAEYYLLSAKTVKDCLFAVADAKQQIERLSGIHSTISKYRNRLWFQKTMQKTEAELLQWYGKIAAEIEQYEDVININQQRLHMHYSAVEYLAKTNMGLRKVNLKQVTLVQLNLF
jgi:hypothetical protein